MKRNETLEAPFHAQIGDITVHKEIGVRPIHIEISMHIAYHGDADIDGFIERLKVKLEIDKRG